ncbi:hypothetical protein N5I87_20815 [Ralstonia sp. CHL-2022]|uniref:Uncharacterized protein n=1 Tax=Ralstonia mojiangensis TaxID=2953895 RepID=A0AAE3LCS4_9RALS|nr:hypothetical protein [Ralstonia mojiangensis]MCT7318469.1 hypothetical protein [Ralstonia mojiangensis]MCT7326773.1 hypothetical protein [Ralstonia mojiangensis]
MDPHQQVLVKLIEKCARRHRRHEVFPDVCELAALSISNRGDTLQHDARGARYLEFVKPYEREEVECFLRVLGRLVEPLAGCHEDALSQVFEALQLSDHYRGQLLNLVIPTQTGPEWVESQGYRRLTRSKQFARYLRETKRQPKLAWRQKQG